MAEVVRDFIHAHVASKDGQDIEESFLRKSIVMSKRRRTPKKRAVRIRKGQLTSESRRQLGFHKLPRVGQQYSVCLQMHHLWQQYMNGYLNLDQLRQQGFRAEPEDTRTENVLLLLCRADFHGACLTVLRSRCSSLLGTTGIVLLETRSTFQIVTPDSKTKLIPKQHTIFETSVEGFKIRLFGNNFLARPAGRAQKKLKVNSTIEL